MVIVDEVDVFCCIDCKPVVVLCVPFGYNLRCATSRAFLIFLLGQEMTRDILFLSKMRQRYQQDAGEASVQVLQPVLQLGDPQQKEPKPNRVDPEDTGLFLAESKCSVEGQHEVWCPLGHQSKFTLVWCKLHTTKGRTEELAASSHPNLTGQEGAAEHVSSRGSFCMQSPVNVSGPFPLPAGGGELLLPALRKASALCTSA